MKKIPLSKNQLCSVMMSILDQLLEPKASPLTEHKQDIPYQSNPLRYQMMKTHLTPQRNPESWECTYPSHLLKIKKMKQKMHNHAR